MANLSTMEATLKAVQAAIAQLENGTISQEGLEDLVLNTRELYERAVVLRYRAYEEKVFGPREEVSVTVPPVFEEPEIVIPVVPVAQPVADTEVEAPMEEEEDEAPSFDFSLFNEPSEEEVNEVPEENEVEHISVSTTITDDFGVHEEKTVMEHTHVAPTASSNSKFIDRFSKTDSALAAQIAMTRLDSLIGSFGLNERLQFINELFDGSSEAFADAIKSIDTLSGIDDALIKTSAFANQYNWDFDSETVEDFVTKIKRRYV